MILIVDDDELMLMLMSRTLEKLEEVETRSSAFGVVNRAAGREGPPPSLIVLDHMMPALDGGTLLGLLARDVEAVKVPVILHSALDETSLRPLVAVHPKATVVSKGRMKPLLDAAKAILAQQ